MPVLLNFREAVEFIHQHVQEWAQIERSQQTPEPVKTRAIQISSKGRKSSVNIPGIVHRQTTIKNI